MFPAEKRENYVIIEKQRKKRRKRFETDFMECQWPAGLFGKRVPGIF